MSPFETYQTYIAIKTHFSNPKYDFFRYGGKMKLNQASFDKRRDKYFFYKLSKHKDVVGFLVANYIATDNLAWIGKLTNTKQAEDNYLAWLSKQQALMYTFANDIALLDDDFNTNFKVSEDNHPSLLTLFNRKKISIETMVILNKLINFIPSWSKNIKETTLWPVVELKIIKYNPFITFDEKLFRDKLISRFQQT